MAHSLVRRRDAVLRIELSGESLDQSRAEATPAGGRTGLEANAIVLDLAISTTNGGSLPARRSGSLDLRILLIRHTHESRLAPPACG